MGQEGVDPNERITVTDEVLSLLDKNSPVAIGVSGGKDSCAVAIATAQYLDGLGHSGPRVLIHADLGLVEWKDSLPTCERLATHLGMELIVVKRAAGGLMERWQTRWRNNVRRYENLECVKLILPWSTASMRFCTSELKTAVICADLVRRFPGQHILSVTGIRREESPNRAKAPIAFPQNLLRSKKYGTLGLNWNSILGMTKEEVFAFLRNEGFTVHEAYRIYESTRVSCVFCILGSHADMLASARCEANQDAYRIMVTLEAESGFSFQENKWLGDIAPHLLSEELRTKLEWAKQKARVRTSFEDMIPKHLLYVKGWPVAVPTMEEAALLLRVRKNIGHEMGFTMKYLTVSSIIARYEELMRLKEKKVTSCA